MAILAAVTVVAMLPVFVAVLAAVTVVAILAVFEAVFEAVLGAGAIVNIVAILSEVTVFTSWQFYGNFGSWDCCCCVPVSVVLDADLYASSGRSGSGGSGGAAVDL